MIKLAMTLIKTDLILAEIMLDFGSDTCHIKMYIVLVSSKSV